MPQTQTIGAHSVSQEPSHSPDPSGADHSVQPPGAKTSPLPYNDPWLGFSPPGLLTPGPRERPYGDFCSKTEGLFIGLTLPSTELPQEITKSVTGIQNQLSTKGQQSQE